MIKYKHCLGQEGSGTVLCLGGNVAQHPAKKEFRITGTLSLPNGVRVDETRWAFSAAQAIRFVTRALCAMHGRTKIFWAEGPFDEMLSPPSERPVVKRPALETKPRGHVARRNPVQANFF